MKRMFTLTDVDYMKLQEYWENYSRYVQELEKNRDINPMRVRQKKSIVDAIEYLFNDTSKDVQEIVQLNWWNKQNIDEVSAMIHMSRSKIRCKQRALLADTADRLHWV